MQISVWSSVIEDIIWICNGSQKMPLAGFDRLNPDLTQYVSCYWEGNYSFSFYSYTCSTNLKGSDVFVLLWIPILNVYND